MHEDSKTIPFATSEFSLLSLLQLADPALPIGGFSHSAGLETYVQQGIVKDKSSARQFIVQMLQQSMRCTDGALLCFAYDATESADMHAIGDLDQECSALKLPMEMRQASIKLGIRLIKIFSSLLQSEVLQSYQSAVLSKQAAGHFAIAFGIIARTLLIEKRSALLSFYYNAAAGMVTNCVKLVPLSQQVGQQLLFSLQPVMVATAADTLLLTREMLGLCCTAFDIRSMQHERLYSRLYMS